jgi:hypothetical protein
MPGWDESSFRNQAHVLTERYLHKSPDYSEKYPLLGAEDMSCIH